MFLKQSKMFLIFLFLFLFKLSNNSVDAVVCPGLSEQNCYNNRCCCHFDGSSCQTGAPNACWQYFFDTVGCTSQPTCTLQTNNYNYCVNICSTLYPTDCLSAVPPRIDCRFNFTSGKCYTTNTYDLCLSKGSQAECPYQSCFWDPYINQCFYNINQVNQVFPCSYWSQQSQYAGTQACAYHGCVLINGGTCSATRNIDTTVDNSTVTINYANNVIFSSATVIPSSTLRLTVSIPFPTSAHPASVWPLDPAWPYIAVLDSRINLLSALTTMPINCSTFNLNYVNNTPVVLQSSPYSAATLKNYTINWVSAYKNLTFNSSDPVGRAAQAIFGSPRTGSNSVVSLVTMSVGSTRLQFTFQADLKALVSTCGAYGATKQISGTDTIYTIPISYIEQSSQGYSQYVEYFTVDIPTTGSAIITSSTVYLLEGFPIETTFPRTNCSTGSAYMSIEWKIIVNNIYDNTREIGPRTINDISLTSTQYPGQILNCYGDKIVDFQKQGCISSNYACYYTVTLQSSCHQITPDGLGFNLCSYANQTDKIHDVGINGNYSSGLDGLHRFFVNIYNCPRTRTDDSLCMLVVNTVNGYPDEIKSYISTLQYPDSSQGYNPWNVQTAFLSTPTSTIASITNYNLNQTNDTNLFTTQAITPIILLPSTLQSAYDLRMMNSSSQFFITPLNGIGQPFLNTGGYSQLTYQQIRPGLLNPIKNDYYNQNCTITQHCQLLPACNGIPGCDGFSVAVAYLKQLMPANGYRFSISYQVNTQSSSGPYRRLLQTPIPQEHVGFLYFDIIIPETDNADCDINQLREQFLIEEYGLQSESIHEIHYAIFDVILPLIFLWFLYYLILSSIVKTSVRV